MRPTWLMTLVLHLGVVYYLIALELQHRQELTLRYFITCGLEVAPQLLEGVG